MRQAGRPKAIIDIYHTDPGRAGVQHFQESRDTAKAGAVASTRGHRDNRLRHQSPHHAWQGSVHSSHDDQHTGGLKVPAAIEQSVQPGDAHVVHRSHRLPEDLGRRPRLFGNRHVGGPRGDNQHLARL